MIPAWPRSVVLAAGGILLAFGLTGCASERSFGAYDRRTHLWETPEGFKAEDPVSGRLLFPEDAVKLEYRGDIYYFENDFDAEIFKRDPGVYDYHGYAPNYGGGP